MATKGGFYAQSKVIGNIKAVDLSTVPCNKKLKINHTAVLPYPQVPTLISGNISFPLTLKMD